MRPKALSGSIAKYSRGLALSVLTLIGAPAVSHAVDYYWNTGTNTWSGTFWSDNATSGGTTGVLPTSSDTITFNQSSVNGAETISLGADRSVLGITFSNTGTTLLQGGGVADQILTIGTSGITINSGAGAVTIGSLTALQSVAIALGGNQSWTNNSASQFTVINGIDNGANLLTIAGTGNTTISGIIGSGVTFSGGLTKNGNGTLTLSAANAYTGATTINRGTLNLGGSTANGSLDSTVLNMAGATLNYTRTGGTTQAFTTTNITAGANTITAVATNTLTLGSLVKTGDATVNFGTTGTITTSTLNDATGILGGWATFGGTNWAVANGAGSAITGFAGTYTMTNSVLNVGASYNAVNIGVNSSQAPNAVITPNTLTFNTSGAYTLTLTGTTNTIPGILVNSAVGNNASLITGGTLRGTNNGTLNISQNNTNANGALTIGSIIASNGTSGLTKTGAGTLVLTGNNTGLTGTTYVNQGRLQINNANSMPAGTTIVQSGAALYFQNASISRSITLNGGSILTDTNDTTYTGTITLTADSAITHAGGAVNDTKWGTTTPGTINTNGFRVTITNSIRSDSTAEAGPLITGGGGLTLTTGEQTNNPRLGWLNTYSGSTAILGTVGTGTTASLIFNTIKNVGDLTGSSFGAPTTVANGTISLGSGTNGVILVYEGSGNTTDRVINLAGTTWGHHDQSIGIGQPQLHQRPDGHRPRQQDPHPGRFDGRHR